MNCQVNGHQLTLELTEQEKVMLLFSLEEIAEHYGLDESKLRGKFQGFWRGTLSRTPLEGEDWKEAEEDLALARWELKSERLELVKKWLAQDGPMHADGEGILILEEHETDHFLSMLNDRRLLLAIEYGLDEEMLDRNPKSAQSAEVQQALWEIHFLAFVQQQMLENL